MHKDDIGAKDNFSFGLGKGIKENLAIEANCFIRLFDKDGNLKEERNIHNTVTTAGKNAIADQILAAPSLVKMGWMAIGTGSPAATLLGAENARVAFDSKTRGTNVVTVVATFGAGVGTGTITEAGTFDVVTANTVNMWMSASFGAVTKAAGDSLVITWTLTIN
jgi:hypothetical protein